MDFYRATLKSNSPQETQSLANIFAPFCGRGKTLLLSGPIGAGKSLFARALILSLLDEPEDIPSPTFTLVQLYETRKFDIWHSDLYRVSDPDDVFELGLDEAFDTAMCLVEWPDRLGQYVPHSAISLNFENTEHPDSRLIEIASHSKVWAPLFEVLDELD